MTRMLLVYTSGRYTDSRGPWFIRQNILEAEQVAADLWRLGFAVICPHKNTAMFDGIVGYETFLAGDFLMVESCHLLVMIPNWRSSKGAKLERQHALRCAVPVFHYKEDYKLLRKLGKDDGFLEEAIASSFEKLKQEACIVE